jgi:predicted nucleotidyltransferase
MEKPTLEELYGIILHRVFRGNKVTFQEHCPDRSMDLDNKVENIYCIFLFGSRLYNCHRETSDYDFISIVGGSYFDNSKLLESDGVNVNCYHIDYVKYLIRMNVVWVLMLCSQYFPQHCVYLRNIELRFDFEHDFDLHCLKNTVHTDSAHNWAKAKKYCVQKGFRDEDISRKNVIHAIRHLRLALQLCRNHVIDDFECANDVWRELFIDVKQDFESWEQQWNYYESQFGGIYYALVEELQSITASQGVNEIPPSNPGDSILPYSRIHRMKFNESLSHTLSYAEKHGLYSLKRDFSIHVDPLLPGTEKEIENNSDLIVCSLDKITPRFSSPYPVGREFMAVVLQKRHEGYEIIAALPPPLPDMYPKKQDTIYDQVEIENLEFCQVGGGFDVLLFFDEQINQWRVYFPAVTKRRYERDANQQHPGYERVCEIDSTEETDHQLLVKQFWHLWQQLGWQLPDHNSNSNVCYHLDLCLSPDHMNNFLMNHTTYRGKEDLLRCVNAVRIHPRRGIIEHVTTPHGWKDIIQLDVIPHVKIHEVASDLDPLLWRGVIVRDKQGLNQVEYRSPHVYPLLRMQLAHLMTEQGIRNAFEDMIRTMPDSWCAELVVTPQWSNRPDIARIYETVKEKYNALLSQLKLDYESLKDLHETGKMKEFSASCRKLGARSSVVFEMFKTQRRPPDILRTYNIPEFKRMLKQL